MPRHHIPMFAGTLLTAAILALYAPFSQGVHAAHVPARTVTAHRVCSAAAPGQFACLAEVVTGAPPADLPAYGPGTFHTAYDLPCTPHGQMAVQCAQPAAFGPETIAIVDAGADNHIEHDLGVFDSAYGLPSCTKANGCLRVVGETGGAAPRVTDGWQLEIALDVETAHGLCQTCRILLVEGNQPTFGDLGTAVDTAARMGATVVSNSYGAFGTDPADAHYYDHSGVAIVASTGDTGVGIESPAAYSTVIAAGGTSLYTDASGGYALENAWRGAGSGCADLPARKWQTADSRAGGCEGWREIADVAADADPNTGAHIYSTNWGDGSHRTGWAEVGGTSLAAPIIASAIALAGGTHARYPAKLPYLHAGHFRDVATGANGSCGGPLCVAGPGYDGPTGLGSPDGIAAFSPPASAPIPTPSPTSLPAPTSTSTPAPTATATATPPMPTPTPTSTNTGHQAQCQASGSLQDCSLAWLDLLNQHRASVGVAPLSYDAVQSAGTGTCVGSQGHSQAMADSGSIWHTDPSNPTDPASFPADLCGSYSTGGENVGESPGTTWQAIEQIDAAMWGEGPGGGHYENIRNPAFTRAGFGIVNAGGVLYLTTDFTG